MPSYSKFTKWLVKHSGGLIKREKDVKYFYFILIGFLILIGLILIFSISTSSPMEETEYNPSEGYGGQELPDDYR